MCNSKSIYILATSKLIKMKNIKTFDNFINYLRSNNISVFSFKRLSIMLSEDENLLISKSKVIFYCKMLKEFDMIEKVSESGNCKTTCASCYEYGCDAGQQPPINYWRLKKQS